ncbi:HlyC/CorC family transporter [Thiohalospira sp.]|uniref:HlyC/CorC family transporter n=1 Tax=Thiohalospira sp. TaxID=3080549 RepID=UPI00397FE2A2
MDALPTWLLFVSLGLLLVLSGFFSSSETGLISLNRYRLRHLADEGHAGARRAERLLQRPDRLIGVILLGNNFVNILASSVATVIAMRLMGQAGIAVATGLLTLVILIFAEVTPKTLAALHPERIAFPASWILGPLLRLLYPLVWLVNAISNGLLRLLSVSPESSGDQPLSREELRTVVNEAGAMIPQRHQRMLLSILDLEKVTVEDIMIPRNEMVGIDLEEPWEAILERLSRSHHTRLPVSEGGAENIIGILHLRNVAHRLAAGELDPEELRKLVRAPYFVPEATPLHTQLLNFQRERRRIGLVVDEYGDIRGLVTLEDILEEIVGEFTTDPGETMQEVHPQEDGSFLVEGSAYVRDLNRLMQWELPTDGPKTLNGLILEHMETIPEPGTSFRLAGYPVEIVHVGTSAVRTVKIMPDLWRPPA